MEIVDAQVHGNRIGSNWQDTDPDRTLELLLAAMDAVGVDVVVLDEFVGFDDDHRILPGRPGPNGSWRPALAFSELAVKLHPERFVFVTHPDPTDPELAEQMADIAKAPGCVGLRLFAGGVPHGHIWRVPAFANGGYDELFEHAQSQQIPVFLMASGGLDLLIPYLTSFPDLQFILDHTGVQFPEDPSEPEAVRYARLEPVLALADRPNVAVKWCHVERLAIEPYPYRDVLPHLRRMVDAFGPERIMWASDATQANVSSLAPHQWSWAQSLHHIMSADLFTESEKEWVLGRTARRVLHWSPTAP